jgi:hypothetical protein
MSFESQEEECVDPYLHLRTHLHGVVHIYELGKLSSMCETESEITFVNGEKSDKNQETDIRIRKKNKECIYKNMSL